MHAPVLSIAMICLLVLSGCVKPFAPPVLQTEHRLLVVEGFINSGPGAVTAITLGRSRRLSDTARVHPERGAAVRIESSGGHNHVLGEAAEGVYRSQPLQLDPSLQYRLSITTADGSLYRSDFVPVQATPPIDSLTWQQENDVTLYAFTHDPENKTRFYRWTFTETWEYHTLIDSHLGFRNGQVFFRDSSNAVNVCWRTAASTDILVATSRQLDRDVIHRFPLATIPQHAARLGVRYSVLVRQYALTAAAFAYWQQLQRNTQSLGGLFDVQPSELTGNLHNERNPAEPVIGYIGASSVTEKRMFIRHSELRDWKVEESGASCGVQLIAPDSARFYLADGLYGPAYYVTGGGLAIARTACVDCTASGGNNLKPSFW